ncbi:hypothetical protein DD509_05425 [Dehalogenimonas alkenigignens]|nr:hypothetical protein DD509_05425 [Dehalogenimonas alkenigignens]
MPAMNKENSTPVPQAPLDAAVNPPSVAGSPAPAAPPRRVGGQPGNQNALVHGFYAKKAPLDRQVVIDEAALMEGLEQEIAFLRSIIERLAEKEDPDPKLVSELMRTLSLVMVRRKYSGHNAVIEKARRLLGKLSGAAAVAGDVASVVEAFQE